MIFLEASLSVGLGKLGQLKHDFSRCPKATVYRKALFRDRNQAIKRTLFTLERRPEAPAVSFTRSIGANSR